MGRSFLHKCYSFLLTIALIVPMVLQLEHVVTTTHENAYCSTPNDVHVDAHELECKPFHNQIDHSTITFLVEETINIDGFSLEQSIEHPVFQKDSDQRANSTRAPPFSLV